MPADIKVHLLNFHGVFNSHIEIVLENTFKDPDTQESRTLYFYINRWIDGSPKEAVPLNELIASASSDFCFTLENADPEDIQNRWIEYYKNTYDKACILSKNCAVAVQWFLTTFANVPEPSLSNVSLNYLSLGILWPSFIPCPVTLPGRVMSNAKFHIGIRDSLRDDPDQSQQYSKLYLSMAMASTALIVAGSIFGAYVALNVLTAGLASVAVAACVVGGLIASYGFFKAYNKLSARCIAERQKKSNPLLKV